MFVSTNAIFLEDDYIINHKPKIMIDLRETGRGASEPPAVKNNMREEKAISLSVPALVPHRSGRIISQPDRYMFLGEAFQVISIKPELDPATYDEAMADVDSAH